MNKPTPGPWKVLSEYYPESQKQEVFPFILDSKGRNVAAALCGSFADEEVNANASLILTAVNSCFAINPDNPMAVAEAMGGLVQDLKYALKIIDAFHVEIRNAEFIPETKGFCRGLIFVEWPEEIRARLAKLEAK